LRRKMRKAKRGRQAATAMLQKRWPQRKKGLQNPKWSLEQSLISPQLKDRQDSLRASTQRVTSLLGCSRQGTFLVVEIVVTSLEGRKISSRLGCGPLRIRHGRTKPTGLPRTSLVDRLGCGLQRMRQGRGLVSRVEPFSLPVGLELHRLGSTT
jgi:hypothetical protein